MVPRPAPQSTLPPLIPEFYTDKELFITGATGFLGKVGDVLKKYPKPAGLYERLETVWEAREALVERVLWTCQEVSKIHLLMRPKKNISTEERLKQLKQSQIFDVIRQNCPQQLDKLSVVAGDITKDNLGLNNEALQQINQVSVVFHSAATVKFDEVLEVAVEHNLRSVLKLMDICDQLPMIQVMVYVSTAYSNADVPIIEERVYPAPIGLRQFQIIVDNLPKHIIREATPSLISPKPNTYTFTKAMAESAVAERAQTSKYATAIFRPSIVASSVQHPFPGWIDKLNGPSGVIASAGKGLLHVVHCSGRNRTDMIPVDIAIDTLIAVAWETRVDDNRETRVYNCCSYENPTTWGEFTKRMRNGVRDYPFDTPLWYPFGCCIENRMLAKIFQWMLHVAPLYALNFLCTLLGIKSRFAKISERLQALSVTFEFFMGHEWVFNTDNVRRLRERLAPADAATFNLHVSNINWDDHCVKFVKGVRRYILQEKVENIKQAHTRLRVLYIIHLMVQCLIVFFICQLAFYAVTTIF